MLWEIFQSLAIILLIVTLLTSPEHYILSGILKAFEQPLTSQKTRRIRQVEKFNNLTSHVYDDEVTVGKTD